MATTTDTNERFPTTGPDRHAYDRYRFDTTTDGDVLIYDEAAAEAWVQASQAVSLDEWR